MFFSENMEIILVLGWGPGKLTLFFGKNKGKGGKNKEMGGRNKEKGGKNKEKGGKTRKWEA